MQRAYRIDSRVQNHRERFICTIMAGALTFACSATRAAFPLNLDPGATPTSQQVYQLHMLTFGICVAIGLLVFGLIAYALLRHRRSLAVEPARFSGNSRLELLWTIIPLLILAGMAMAATRTLVLMEDSSDSELTIKITGYQWRWHYEYLGEEIDFFSSIATEREAISGTLPKGEHYLREVDNPLVLPTGRKIRFLTTSNDVIHSWWVPALGWKKDVIPGFINDAWAYIERPGTYRGQCAELCGRDHAFMPIVVLALADQEFDEWMSEFHSRREKAAAASQRDWSEDELLAKGKETYLGICAACHQADGKGIANVFPSLVESPVVAGPLDGHLEVVLNGRPGTAMQAFANQLTDSELAAVVSYERSVLAQTETLLQPADIQAARDRLQARQ